MNEQLKNQNTIVDERRGATSASNALADSLCPGRHLAQAGLPDTGSEDSERGDRIHQALAQNNARPFNMLSLSLEEREAFDMCREDERKLVLQYFGEGIQSFRVFREERYWTTFQHEGWTFQHSGKTDVVFRVGPKALIIDYKTGRKDVEDSPRNLQLRDQAVLVRGNMVSVTEIATAIVQPFATRQPVICVYTAADLDAAAAEMFPRVVKSNTPGQARIAGEMQCQYCKAKRACSAYQKFAGQMTPPAMLTVLDVPMANWSPEQRAVAASALAPAEKFLKELKAFLKEGIASQPGFVPGWTLSKGRTTETIANPTECFKRFLGIGGKPEDFMRCVKVGKTDLREALNAATGAKGKALDAAMKALTDGIVVVSTSEGSLKQEEAP